jgi:hypothetical protein
VIVTCFIFALLIGYFVGYERGYGAHLNLVEANKDRAVSPRPESNRERDARVEAALWGNMPPLCGDQQHDTLCNLSNEAQNKVFGEADNGA